MAQVDYFLKISGVPGESTDHKHKDEIDVESFSWGASQSGVVTHGGGMGAGKVTMQEFHFQMRVNKSSPKILGACTTGEHFKDAILVARKAGKEQQEYLVVKLTDCMVTSYQAGGSRGDVVPIDSVSLNFAKIEFEYKPQKPDGTLDAPVKVGYDVKLNKKV
jgi:type VI secretion system secreted protein Hcp